MSESDGQQHDALLPAQLWELCQALEDVGVTIHQLTSALWGVNPSWHQEKALECHRELLHRVRQAWSEAALLLCHVEAARQAALRVELLEGDDEATGD